MQQNSSSLRYGFELDRTCLVDIGMHAQIVMSIMNTFVLHPMPLYILFRKSRAMSADIRRCYIAMHFAFIFYEVVFFFLIRIYPITPWPGLYCEGPLCQLDLSNQAMLGIISLPIVFLQLPFFTLIVRMHQAIIGDSSPFSLSKRAQLLLAIAQAALICANTPGFFVFGNAPDNYDRIVEEPELAFLDRRGRILLMGTPGDPQQFRYELFYFYFSISVNFPVLCFCIVHVMHRLKVNSQMAKSQQTQILTKKMFEVFFLQLHGSLVNHVFPLAFLMLTLLIDTRSWPAHFIAILKIMLLLIFTLNSAQFCAIFILKNSANRKIIADLFRPLFRVVSRSKVVELTPTVKEREPSFSISYTHASA